jgi:hypothetical protein
MHFAIDKTPLHPPALGHFSQSAVSFFSCQLAMFSSWWNTSIEAPIENKVNEAATADKNLATLLAQVTVLQKTVMPRGSEAQVGRIVQTYLDLHTQLQKIKGDHHEALRAFYEFMADGAFETITGKDLDCSWVRVFKERSLVCITKRPDLAWIDETYTRCFSRSLAEEHAGTLYPETLRTSTANKNCAALCRRASTMEPATRQWHRC